MKKISFGLFFLASLTIIGSVSGCSFTETTTITKENSLKENTAKFNEMITDISRLVLVYEAVNIEPAKIEKSNRDPALIKFHRAVYDAWKNKVCVVLSQAGKNRIVTSKSQSPEKCPMEGAKQEVVASQQQRSTTTIFLHTDALEHAQGVNFNFEAPLEPSPENSFSFNYVAEGKLIDKSKRAYDINGNVTTVAEISGDRGQIKREGKFTVDFGNMKRPEDQVKVTFTVVQKLEDIKVSDEDLEYKESIQVNGNVNDQNISDDNMWKYAVFMMMVGMGR